MPSGKSGKTRPISFRVSLADYALMERYLLMQRKQARYWQDDSVGEYCQRIIIRWIHRHH